MRSRWLDALAVVILVAALAARLVRLDAFIAADELRWVCRSLAFGQALAAGDFKNTFQTGHPGVVTMWLGTLAVPTGQAPASVLATCRATENGESPSAATAAQLAELAATLFHMRVAPALFNSLLLALAYWLTRRLVGPWPEAEEIYRERSPLFHLDRLSTPMLILQGMDDKVVPPNQAFAMADAVRAAGKPLALITFEGEGHGFRRLESRRIALEAELSFLEQIFGLPLSADVPRLEIENL